MPPLTVQLLVAVTCFTAVYIRGEAADTCPTTTASCIPGLPGRDGEDGQPGRDGVAGHDGSDGQPGQAGRDGVAGPAGRDGVPGRDGRDGPPGPPGSLSVTQEIQGSILNMLREEINKLNCCSSGPITPIPEPSCNITSQANPAASCQDIYRGDPTTPSGYYWVNTVSGPQQVYCEMNTTRCGNITAGWTRVAHINMTDPQQTCPSALLTITSPQRMCATLSPAGCYSVHYHTLGLNFTHVCGQAIGYKYSTTDGFNDAYGTIDNPYVDGLSITYGIPRHHLWTYVAAHDGLCLCSANVRATQPPSFVGQHYYCDDGINGNWDHRLWDGEDCPTGNTCCDPPDLPWFHRTLDTTTADDIEVRWCCTQPSYDEDVGVELLELYVY